VTPFRFVEQDKARDPVRILWSALEVSPIDYCARRSRGPSDRAVCDAALEVEIRRSHARSRGSYGVPRVHADLAEAGHHVSRKRVARLMRRDRLAGVHRRRFVRTTIHDEHATPFPELVDRDFTATVPTRSGSLTSHSCRRGGGPANSPRSSTPATHMRAEFVSSALDAAIVRRRPGSGLVPNSGHGSQYTSLASRRRVRESEIAASMGSVGDRHDNAIAESSSPRSSPS
jgi:putative transposase